MIRILNRTFSVIFVAVLVMSFALSLSGCNKNSGSIQTTRGDTVKETETTTKEESTFTVTDYPLIRNNTDLHLDCTTKEDSDHQKNILLIHGVTYSSHEFDIDYKDYSLVRFLAKQGYAVWKLDISGFGLSGEVDDGFMPDSDYAAEDIKAAVELIIEKSDQEKIDILGWSWGTVTASRYAVKHSEHLNRLVLYAPILSGLGEYEVSEDFHHNTWEHAADDFQKNDDGSFDYNITEREMIDMFCSSCWHYDGEQSPNGGRRDICVNKSEKLIDLSKIEVKTLLICGGSDPYLDYDLIDSSSGVLPEGSRLEIIEGGAHVIMYERPYYKTFQKKLVDFLNQQ